VEEQAAAAAATARGWSAGASARSFLGSARRRAGPRRMQHICLSINIADV